MACILQPECKFLHSFIRCHLPVEMVNVELKMTLMQGTHTFRRDRTCQVIKCNPWNTRLHPHPTIIKKMKTYLVLEGKLGPKLQSQSDKFRPPQPNTNPHVRKDSKATKKRKRLIPTKKYKVKVVARSNPGNESTPSLQTNPEAPMNPEGEKSLPEGTPGNNPTIIRKHPSSCQYPLAQSRENVWEPFRVEKRLANSSYQEYHCYHKIPNCL